MEKLLAVFEFCNLCYSMQQNVKELSKFIEITTDCLMVNFVHYEIEDLILYIWLWKTPLLDFDNLTQIAAFSLISCFQLNITLHMQNQYSAQVKCHHLTGHPRLLFN